MEKPFRASLTGSVRRLQPLCIWFKETFSAEAANKNAATPHQQNRARCHSLKRGRQVTIDSEHETVGLGNDWQRSTKILKDWGGTGPEQDLPSPSFTKPLATNAASSKQLRYGHSQDSPARTATPHRVVPFFAPVAQPFLAAARMGSTSS